MAGTGTPGHLAKPAPKPKRAGTGIPQHMKATKITALISGAILAIVGIWLESQALSIVWLAIIFIPAMLIYVIGFEVWREWAKGLHIGPGGPRDATGLSIYGAAILRMGLFFIGAAIGGMFYVLAK